MVERFQPKDLGVINEWAQAQGVGGDIAGPHLPAVGAIVPGVACGFLYQTDSAISFIDNLLANPNAKLREMSKAVDVIVEYLTSYATSVGCQDIVVITRRRSVARRAVKLGFHHVGQRTMLTKVVGG